MLIEIDLKEVKSLKLTINQYVFLSMIINRNDIKSLIDVIPVSESDIIKLKELNILTEDSAFEGTDFSKLSVSDDFRKMLQKKDLFDDFYELYPLVVQRADGKKDYLRGDVSRCRQKYNSIIGKSKAKHLKMLNAIEFEVQRRNREGSMGYMKRMYKWLTSEEYLLYDEYIKSREIEVVKGGSSYGTELE
jgi:hypothetical protein